MANQTSEVSQKLLQFCTDNQNVLSYAVITSDGIVVFFSISSFLFWRASCDGVRQIIIMFTVLQDRRTLITFFNRWSHGTTTPQRISNISSPKLQQCWIQIFNQIFEFGFWWTVPWNSIFIFSTQGCKLQRWLTRPLATGAPAQPMVRTRFI